MSRKWTSSVPDWLRRGVRLAIALFAFTYVGATLGFLTGGPGRRRGGAAASAACPRGRSRSRRARARPRPQGAGRGRERAGFHHE
jgi:hypothetical protein